MATVAAPVVGREQELAAIRDVLAAPGFAAVVLEGDPGAGKTTVWRGALDEAGARGVAVLHARAAEAERGLSYAALAALIAPLLDAVERLPAPQRRALRVALVLDDPDGVPPDRRAVGAALV